MRIHCLLYGLLALVAAGSLGFASVPNSIGDRTETEYLAVFLEGKKVGHAVHSRVIENGKVTNAEEVSITISRAGVPVTVKMAETCIETTKGEPLGFEVVQELGLMTMTMKGTVNDDGMVNLTVASMGTEQKKTFQWPGNGEVVVRWDKAEAIDRKKPIALMAEGLRLLHLRKTLKEGLTYSAKVFSPGILQAVDTEVRIGAKQSVDLLGRVVTLTEVTSTMNLPETGKIVSTSYVDDDLRVQKTITPIAGMQVEMVACAKNFALSENDVFEVVERLFVASPIPLKDVDSAKSAVYHLSPTKGADLPIPSNDNQKVRRLNDGSIIVTVAPAAAPQGAKFPYKGKDKATLEAMAPTRFLQSDRQEIIDLARRAAGDTKDAAEAVKRIESFVARYIQNRSLSVGYASAAEVAKSRQGDCSEFAVLTAAMCRAVGIPAQVVTGIAYVEDFAGLDGFGGHAWVQAYIGGESGKWIGLDAAFKSAGRGTYGPGHIALAVGNGDPEGFFDLVNTLGQFKIDKVIVNKGK